MTLRDLLSTSWHNVRRRFVRTALAATGVTVGVLVLVTLLSFGIGVRQEAAQQFDRIGLEWVEVRPPRSGPAFLSSEEEPNTALTASRVQAWQERADVVEVETTIDLPGREYTFLRYEQAYLPINLYQDTISFEGPFTPQTQIIAGHDLRFGHSEEMVVGEDVATNLGLDAPPELLSEEVQIVLQNPRGDEASFDFTVVGISDAPYREVRISTRARQMLKEWWLNETDLLETVGYDSVALRTHSIDEAIALADELSAAGFDVHTTQMQFQMVQRAFLIIEVLLGSVGGLALFVAGIGIANTMVMSIYERTREIGLLKALGASRGDIRALFVTEAATIGLLGAGIGLVLGWLLSLGLNRLILAFLRWQEVPVRGTFFRTTPSLALLALLFGAAVGGLAGLIPAARAARMDPVQALRYE